MAQVKVNDEAPAFTLKAGDGSTVTLGQYRGKKPVVLFFYPKDDTAICTKEVCAFRDSFADFQAAGAVVLGVSSDSRESHDAFAGKHHLPYPLLADEGGAVRKLYGVPSTMGLLPGRVTYVIDREGVVRHVFNSQLDAGKHVDEALKTLKSLGASG